jgi:DNA-binding NarL/FixJ family response regulator
MAGMCASCLEISRDNWPVRIKPKFGPDGAEADVRARVLVVDDHPLVREGLAELINRQEDLVCCGQAGSALEAQVAVAEQQPDLVLLDLRLGHADGLELIRLLRNQSAGLRILAVSQLDQAQYAERALRAGARGYVMKEQATGELLSAVRAVLAGEIYLTRGTAALLLHRLVGAPPKAGRAGLKLLTDRELHVLQLLGAGLSTKEIALELKLSFRTVETHRLSIKRKLRLRGAAELRCYACQWSQEQVTLLPQLASDGGASLDA